MSKNRGQILDRYGQRFNRLDVNTYYIDDNSRRQNKRQRILKGKPRLCQFLLHFTTYFTNVSYVNSKRPKKEGCSNEWGKKGRSQEAGGRKKRRRQRETVKMGEEREERMDGRERGIKQFHGNFWFDVAKR